MLARIYRLLRNREDPVIDRSMAEALPTADPLGQRLIVLSLLERGREPGLAGLVRAAHQLEPELEQLLVEHMGEFDPAVRAAARDSDPQAARNAVSLTVRSGADRLSYLLAEQLRAADGQLVREAGAALRKLAERFHRDREGLTEQMAPNPRHKLAQRASWLGQALGDAAGCFHLHGRRDVLLAAAMLAPLRPDRLMERLTDRRGQALSAMQHLIREERNGPIDRALLFFAGEDALRPAVQEALRSPSAIKRLGPMLELSHLLLSPTVSRQLRRVQEGWRLLPDERTAERIGPAGRRALPRWIRAVRVEEGQRARALGAVVHDQDPAVRLTTLRALMRTDHERARELISCQCFDPAPSIARIALRHLIRVEWPGLSNLLVKLTGSPHPQVRRLAEQRLAPMGFQKLWDNWEHLDGRMRLAAGRALKKLDPQFRRALGERMRGRDAETRLKALMIVRTLGEEQAFEEQLLELAADAERRVASSAAAALGRVPGSQQAQRTLRSMLDHEDDRVRANAVESLERSGQLDEAQQALRQVAQEGGNRSRANAVKAMLNQPMAGGVEALERMLGDTDPRHRISALWVVEQMGLAALARHVADLAQQEQDPKVRQRAVELVRRMAAAEAEAEQPAGASETDRSPVPTAAHSST